MIQISSDALMSKKGNPQADKCSIYDLIKSVHTVEHPRIAHKGEGYRHESDEEVGFPAFEVGVKVEEESRQHLCAGHCVAAGISELRRETHHFYF